MKTNLKKWKLTVPGFFFGKKVYISVNKKKIERIAKVWKKSQHKTYIRQVDGNVRSGTYFYEKL